MYKYIFRILEKNFFFNIYSRRSILLLIDSFLILISIRFAEYFSSYVNKPSIYVLENKHKFLIIILGLIFNILTKQYKSITKYISSKAIYSFTIRNFIFSFLLYFLFKNIVNELTLFFCLLYAIILTYITLIVRFVIKDFSISITKKKNIKGSQNIVIYGAGAAGAQIASNLSLNNKYIIDYFVDDSQFLWGRTINGIKVEPPLTLKKVNNKIDKILFAIPSIDLNNKRRIFNFLGELNIPILQLPSIDELIYKNENIDTLKPISIEEILGRDPVKPDEKIISKIIKNNSILVTGGAGSIGSELSRQILKFKPSKLIIVDQSELNLYNLGKNLPIKNEETELKFVLGNVTNSKLIELLIEENNIECIVHAAAYKHVPLLESNIMQGLLNNVLSTRVICKCAFEKKVKKVMLISSDKAVRPTNIMGASKRISELIFQAYAALTEDREIETVFSMVRFGNVLGSSGSVVPLFREQLSNGGPITLTDPNVIRYFMTIKEATELVLHSIALAKGGDVFLLDMGKPMRIFDLAKKMVFLSGLSVKSESNPKGDIEIKNIGLRPGEKLYEELLIDSESEPTEHPLIFRAKEKMIEFLSLESKINQLCKFSLDNDKDKFIELVTQLVPEYSSQET